MPSPDVAAYVGLELVDVDAQTLIDTALTNLAETFPDWEPREGNTEVVLLEQLAAIVEEDVYAINALPDGIAEALLRLFGLTRDQGAPPTASVRFVLADTGGHTIPQGTTVRLDLGAGVEPVDLVTDADLVIPADYTTGIVSASGVDPTVEANGKAPDTPLELLDAVNYVDRVELATAAAGGRLPEDGAAFLARAIPHLSRLTTTLVRPVDVEAYVVEAADVTRVRVLDLYNPADPASAPGRTPGYVTVAVAAAGGGTVAKTVKDTIAADLRNRMHAGLIVTVRDADVTTVDVTVRVLRFASADDDVVAQAVRQAIADYLNPDTWAWGGVVFVNELIGRVDAVPGVDLVLEVATPNGDLPITGYAPLARAGTITVTVEAPA